MMKKLKMIVLTVVATMVLGGIPAAASENVGLDFETETTDIYREDIQVGDIIPSMEGGTEIILEVHEDGSIISKKYETIHRAKSKCPHLKLNQYTLPAPLQNGPRDSRACLYRRYSTIYKCERCPYKTKIITAIPEYHSFKNNKCTKCGYRKKK